MVDLQPATRIERRSLHVELVERLRRMIVEGDLAPGEKIPERDLCDRFDVSRTPLREALKVLAREGLVVLTPNRGAAVTRVTAADLAEIFPVLGALEALSGELACAAITPSEIARLRRLHENMVERYRAGDLPGYFNLNQQIHEGILAAAGNETLSGVYGSLAGRVRRARYLANMSRDRWGQAVEEHEAIIEALEARDAARLSAVLKRHLANKFETIREWLARDDPN